MSRHFWRACDREAGFSFVELLVTIIIAGIAFAALVPVFVGAQQTASGSSSATRRWAWPRTSSRRSAVSTTTSSIRTI